MKFLIVDDDEDARTYLERVLVSQGHDVVTASNGLDALALIRESPPDVVVSDIMMPEMDGFTLCRRIKQNPGLVHIPFVFYSATYTDPRDEELARAIGVSRLLVKPLEPLEFLQAMNEIVAESAQGAESVPYDAELDEEAFDALHLQTVARKLEEKVQALEASEEQFRHLIEGSIQGILIHRNAKPLFANHALADMLGYPSPDEIIRLHSLLPLIAPHDRERMKDDWQNCMEGPEAPVHAEFQVLHRDGTWRWLDHLVRRVRWEGTPAIQSTIVDITQRKQAEEDRARLERQLRQSQKMEAVGTLAAGIAHDFNNILSAIYGFTELAQAHVSHAEPPADGQLVHYLDEVLMAAGRARNLVRQLLAASRQEPLEPQPVSVAAIVKETLALVQATLPSSITTEVRIDETAGQVMTDPSQLHQIAMNLCVNAEHAMRGTQGTLAVTVDAAELRAPLYVTSSTLPPGSYARITVRDTGHGIAPENIGRIFDPFFTTKGAGEGTGMGLATVHGIVMKAGGGIEVESVLGEGTTFVIYLPRIEVRPEELDPPETPSGLGQSAARILFVDDEPAIADAVSKLLEILGHTVTTRTSSSEALEVFRAAPQDFDLLITDQTMPQMTGDVLAQELRHIRPDLPIILCTGFSHTMDAEKAHALDVDAFCMKPIRLQELAEMIQQVLTRRIAPKTPTPARILLIDDDDQLRAMVRHMLEVEGYEIDEARNGREGAQQYQTAQPDLVITDLLMPEQEGLETIHDLRRVLPDVKIIAISGGMRSRQGTMDFRTAAQRFGARWMIRKPFARDELLRVVLEALQA